MGAVDAEARGVNRTMEEHYDALKEYRGLRDQLMGILDDDDLDVRLGGATETLGALCRELAEVQRSYTESFETFRQDFSARDAEPERGGSVAALTAWYAELDGELAAALERLSDDDVANRLIDRGGGFTVPPPFQLDVLREALLIFYGKASVYLKAMEKPLPKQWQDWIG